MNASQSEAKFGYIKLNIPQLARLGLFSRSTQGYGWEDFLTSPSPVRFRSGMRLFQLCNFMLNKIHFRSIYFNVTLDYSSKTNPPDVQLFWPRGGMELCGDNFTVRFWLENVPLNSGINDLSITVSDVVGNTTVTNISVSQSSMTLTMYPIYETSELWHPTIAVIGGKVSDPTADILEERKLIPFQIARINETNKTPPNHCGTYHGTARSCPRRKPEYNSV